MRSSQVTIDSPCHESWETMDGDAERRFCGVCQKHVHNLSAMRLDEARDLLARSNAEPLCVRYTAEADGTLRFRDLVPRARLTRNLVRGVFAAIVLAACGSPADAPVVDLGDAVIDSLRDATVPTSDGGCDLSTGPFTTFHLAPGHVLCRSNGHDDAALPPAIVQVPAPLEVPPAIVQVPATLVVPPPLAEPDPIPVPMMGQAIAAPELVEPFVPCDPPALVEPVKPKPRTVRPRPEPHPDVTLQGGLRFEPPPVDRDFAPPPPSDNRGFAPPPPGPIPVDHDTTAMMGSVSLK
jgi:hypothetical protein